MPSQIDVEQAILKIDTTLTEAALETFNEGEVSQGQLKEFYSVLTNWLAASERMLNTMHRIGLRAQYDETGHIH